MSTLSVKKRPQATASRKRKPVQTRNKGQSRSTASRSRNTAAGNKAKNSTASSRSRAPARDKKGQARASAQTRNQSEASQRFSANLQGAAKDGVAIAMLAVCAFLLLAFFSYSPNDPGWSSSGPQQEASNWMGNGGAWLSDVLFSLLGDAALWLPAILGFSGWSLLRKRVAHYEWDPTALAVRIIGLAMVLVGTCIIAHLHFDSSTSELPYKDGGIIGQGLSQVIGSLLGVYGTTLVALALLLGGIPMMTNCSWLTIMEKVGKGMTAVLGFISGKYAAAREEMDIRRTARNEQKDDSKDSRPARSGRVARVAEEPASEPERPHGATRHEPHGESWWARLTGRLRGGKGVDISRDESAQPLPDSYREPVAPDPLFNDGSHHSRDIPWDEAEQTPSRRTRGELKEDEQWPSLETRGESAYRPVDEPVDDYRHRDEFKPAAVEAPRQWGQSDEATPAAQTTPNTTSHQGATTDRLPPTSITPGLAAEDDATQNAPTADQAAPEHPPVDVTRRRIPEGFDGRGDGHAEQASPASAPAEAPEPTLPRDTLESPEAGSSDEGARSGKPRVRVGANGRYESGAVAAGAATAGLAAEHVAQAAFTPADESSSVEHSSAPADAAAPTQSTQQTAPSSNEPAVGTTPSVRPAPAQPEASPQADVPDTAEQTANHSDAEQEPEHEVRAPVTDDEPDAVGHLSALDDDDSAQPEHRSLNPNEDDVASAADQPAGPALFADQPVPSDDEVAAAQPVAPEQTPTPATEAPSPAPAAADTAAAESPESTQPEPAAAGPRVWTVEQLQNQGSPMAQGEPVGEMPTTTLLTPADDAKPSYTQEQLDSMGQMLETRLKEYGVKAEVVDVSPGPVITRFEIEPAPGVKSSKISNLSTDLARSLRVKSVRVIEVIQGRSTVGIEIPNPKREMIRLRQVLDSSVYRDAASPVTVALGQSIGGQPIVADLGKMPHVLVAGTTGSGKSVGVNAMLISMLLKSTPDDVRMILIDPKMLELSVYDDIPHLLAPVVTDMKEAANSLRWCVAEMERRYKLMSKMGVRNIAGFNAKLDEAHAAGAQIADPLWDPEPWQASQPQPMLEKLPYIVVVIDEFADMFMVVGKKVEELIARLAQKARAAGIHLVLATQRPSVDVVTGLIKANIPSRIAFQVSSKTDSRTILDQGGAESLLGHGDMLYLAGGSGSPVRVHGAFVDDNEVHRVVEDWKVRGKPDYVEEILSGNVSADALSGLEADSEGGSDAEQDALYDDAVAFVTEKQKVSVSSVQRNFKIGYNRASRLVEAMEHAGVVSEMGANGGREVLARAAPRD